jgi:hypothetical protein
MARGVAENGVRMTSSAEKLKFDFYGVVRRCQQRRFGILADIKWIQLTGSKMDACDVGFSILFPSPEKKPWKVEEKIAVLVYHLKKVG